MLSGPGSAPSAIAMGFPRVYAAAESAMKNVRTERCMIVGTAVVHDVVSSDELFPTETVVLEMGLSYSIQLLTFIKYSISACLRYRTLCRRKVLA